MKVKDLNLTNSKYQRAGVIPYKIHHGVKFYAFGISVYDSVITDFGGTKDPIDSDLLDTAIREYREESLEVFGVMNRSESLEMEVLDGSVSFQILLPVEKSIFHYFAEFEELIKDDYSHEIQNIIWLTKEQLQQVLSNNNFQLDGIFPFKMYWKLLDVLHKNQNSL